LKLKLKKLSNKFLKIIFQAKKRTPLHGILGMSHLLERSPLNQEQQKYTAIIRSATDNLLLSMNELLNLSFDIQAPTNSQNLVKDKWVTNIPTSWRHKKILLIEDNEVNLIYAQNLFASGQVPLDIAKNLAIAAHKLNEQRYDCILSDVKLSDGNSFELITKLRGNNSAINQKTPIIVLTASANEKEANYAKTLNIQSYISKPFPPQLIISEMRKVLQEGSSSTVISSTKFQQSEAPVTLPPYFAHLEKNFKNKPKLQIEMFEIFLGQLPLAIEQMGKGLADNDLKVFHYDAHRIKSTINIIGLPKLKPLITKMDEYCYKKIHLDQLPKLYEQFKKQAAEDIKIISARKEALMVAS